MTAPKTFDQATALIARLMEGVGGSADAYEPPVAPTPASTQEPRQLPEDDPVLRASKEDLPLDCLGGEAKSLTAEELAGLWIYPLPISDDYLIQGVVEDAGELKPIFEALEQSIISGKHVTVALESGSYATQKGANGLGWILIDPVKDRRYVQQIETGAAFKGVDEGDTFIWVMQESNHDVDLGYIHEGYVFLRN